MICGRLVTMARLASGVLPGNIWSSGRNVRKGVMKLATLDAVLKPFELPFKMPLTRPIIENGLETGLVVPVPVRRLLIPPEPNRLLIPNRLCFDSDELLERTRDVELDCSNDVKSKINIIEIHSFLTVFFIK